MLQCVAVCCSVLRCVIRGGFLSRGTRRRRPPRCVYCHVSLTVFCNVLQCVAVCCSVRSVAACSREALGGEGYCPQCKYYHVSLTVCCSVLQCKAMCCNVGAVAAGVCGALGSGGNLSTRTVTFVDSVLPCGISDGSHPQCSRHGGLTIFEFSQETPGSLYVQVSCSDRDQLHGFPTVCTLEPQLSTESLQEGRVCQPRPSGVLEGRTKSPHWMVAFN